MRLKRLHLQNFRCFQNLTVEFDPKLTVIIAENGTGKTAVLDAIATGFGRYLTKLGKKGQTLKHSDLQVLDQEKLAPHVAVTLETEKTGSHKPDALVWSLSRKRNPVSKIDTPLVGTKSLDDFANQLLQKQEEGLTPQFPLVVYYGTNRGILGEVQRRRNFRRKFAPLDALDGALEPTARFKAAFEWFNAMEDEERREREKLKDFNFRLPQLQYVRSAIERALTHLPADGVFDTAALPVLFSNPRTETRPLRFVIDQHLSTGTRTLRINQLSDGYRIMLGLIMDLARRQAEAFSFTPNVSGGYGTWPSIVLIDEVDLHLHPRWQQVVLTQLQRIFKSTQFIVTTHSPQVLTSVPTECIRILQDGAVYCAPAGTEGAEPGRILTTAQGLKSLRPPESPATKELMAYLALVDQDKWDMPEALALRQKLDARYQGNEPALLEADLLIENKKWEQGE